MVMCSFSLRRRLTAIGLGSSLVVAGLLSPAGPAGAATGDPPAAGVTSIQVLATNDFHGRIKANGVEAGAAVLAGAVEQLRAENPNTVFAAAGDLIGASTFESFIAHDKPTIDALNAAGLQVSAVGNHEFDQGYSDLVNRVMAPYDATTNPYGGATWKYLGANVRDTATGNPALPETWTIDLSGIKVGFVGVVTHHLPELVSPTGIAGLTIEPEVTAANRSAAALKAAGADIVVMLVHEGAATTAYSSAVGRHRGHAGARGGCHDGVQLRRRPGFRLRQDRPRGEPGHRRDRLRSHPPRVQPQRPGPRVGGRRPRRDFAAGRLGRSVRHQPEPLGVPGRQRHEVARRHRLLGPESDDDGGRRHDHAELPG
jgi:hypothetical protein